MPIHITMNDAVTRGAEYLLSRQRVSQERKNQIMPASKYNLLVKGFNLSSILLVIAAVSAIFLALTSSFVFLSIGLFLRFTTERELEKYTVPSPPRGLGERIADLVHANILRHALHQTTDEEKVQNILLNVGIAQAASWQPNEILFLDFIAWKNTIEIPEVIEQIQAPNQAGVSNAVPSADQQGFFGNLNQLIFRSAQQQN